MRAMLLALVVGFGGIATGQSAPHGRHGYAFHVSSLNGFALDGMAMGTDVDFSAGASVGTKTPVPVLHRIILDRTHNLYLGYDLVATPTGVPNKVFVHFEPLSDLAGFNADFSTFHKGFVTLPADHVVMLDTPIAVPLESRGNGADVLTDTLTFHRLP